MPVYQATFKSGSQQFFEMDEDDANYVSQPMFEIAAGAPRVNPIYQSSCGATIDCSELVGFQHYITPGYAVARSSSEDSGVLDFRDALEAALVAITTPRIIDDPEDGVSVVTGSLDQAYAAFEAALQASHG